MPAQLPFLRPSRLGFGTVWPLLAMAWMLAAQPLHAQQFVVDDAGVTDPGSCQLEGWLGESAGSVLPACTPIGAAEITLGAGYLDEDHGDHTHREVEYVAQVKVNLRPDDPGAMGASLVAGLGMGPIAQAAGLPFEEFFVYVPLTYTLADERALFHLNGGWTYAREESAHRALYGIRSDVVLHHRVTAVGELFGEGSQRGVQGGLRFEVIPDILMVDASYGWELSGGLPDIGFALGVALTPRPFFTPVRQDF